MAAQQFYPPFADPEQVIEYGDIRMGVVNVDGPLAKEWLDERNVRNRTISENTVKAYVRDIILKSWAFTGDPVQFSREGGLLNGQHRLTAIEQTGVVVPLLVITGLDQSTQNQMDGGRRRTASDVLAIEGMENYQNLAAIARLALTWNPNFLWSPTRRTSLVGDKAPVTTAEILGFVRANEGVHGAARRARLIGRALPGSRPSVIGAAYLRATRLPGGVFVADEWFSKLENGAGLALDDPILALRSHITRAARESRRTAPNTMLWMLVRTWNASAKGEALGRLMTPGSSGTRTAMTNDRFPDMLPMAASDRED